MKYMKKLQDLLTDLYYGVFKKDASSKRNFAILKIVTFVSLVLLMMFSCDFMCMYLFLVLIFKPIYEFNYYCIEQIKNSYSELKVA